MIRRAFANTSKLAFNLLYRAFDRDQRQNEVVFLSRQTNTPSYDFSELAREFDSRGWNAVMHLKKVSTRNFIAYAFHVLKEIRLLGRCSIAILDRYDPVVSLLNFKCEQTTKKKRDDVESKRDLCNTDFPAKPVIFQMWHAFGAFKKFGYQSVNTPEGHSTDFTDAFSIHHNYSWVMCSGEGARSAFAEAFSCPRERVVALDRPEYDELLELRESRIAQLNETSARAPVTVLMAPTLRINDASAHPFRDLYEYAEQFEEALGVDVVWSFHPLDAGLPAPGNVSDQLLNSNILVTDYSSIVYEAYLLGIPVVFYVPDIDVYRTSPGLNADPGLLSPEICTYSQEELTTLLKLLCDDATAYPQQAFERFASSAFDMDIQKQGSAASRIVDFLLSRISVDQ